MWETSSGGGGEARESDAMGAAKQGRRTSQREARSGLLCLKNTWHVKVDAYFISVYFYDLGSNLTFGTSSRSECIDGSESYKTN